MKKAANNNTSIRVFCRMRPLNQLELSTGGECCITHNETSIRLKVTQLCYNQQNLGPRRRYSI